MLRRGPLSYFALFCTWDRATNISWDQPMKLKLKANNVLWCGLIRSPSLKCYLLSTKPASAKLGKTRNFILDHKVWRSWVLDLMQKNGTTAISSSPTFRESRRVNSTNSRIFLWERTNFLSRKNYPRNLLLDILWKYEKKNPQSRYQQKIIKCLFKHVHVFFFFIFLHLCSKNSRLDFHHVFS